MQREKTPGGVHGRCKAPATGGVPAPEMRRSILLLTLCAALGSGCAKAGSDLTDYPDDFSAVDDATMTATPQAVGAGAVSQHAYRGDVGGELDADDILAVEGEDASMLESRAAEYEAMPREEAANQARGGLFSRIRDRRTARKSKRAPAREVASVAPAAAPEPAAAPDPAPAIADEEPDPAAHGRQIIYTAAMHVTVFNIDEAMEAAQEIPEKHGGYVHSLSEGHIVMRIPAKHLRSVMDALGEYGVVENRTLNAQDVTAEYVDLESRIRVLRETQNQLIELLGKARTVEEALRVRETLDRITMELELALGRMRQLENLVSFSTLTLTMVERGPHQPIPSSNDPFPWVDGLGVEATEWK